MQAKLCEAHGEIFQARCICSRGKTCHSCLLSFFISANASPYMPDYVCMNAGEAGAAHLLLSVWDLPVQQWQRESGPAHSGEDVFCVVTAETSQPQSEEHAVLFTLGDRT